MGDPCDSYDQQRRKPRTHPSTSELEETQSLLRLAEAFLLALPARSVLVLYCYRHKMIIGSECIGRSLNRTFNSDTKSGLVVSRADMVPWLFTLRQGR
jgi:hypothetical protein